MGQAYSIFIGWQAGDRQQHKREVNKAVCDREEELAIQQYGERCKGQRNDLQNPFEYLKYLFEKLLNMDIEDKEALDKILPWSTSLPDCCRVK